MNDIDCIRNDFSGYSKMIKCLACGKRHTNNTFKCPSCGFEPELIDGFPIFAPELLITNDGFTPEFFEYLYESEAGNFWFRNRNRLIISTLERFFPYAGKFLEVGCGTGYVLSGIQNALPAYFCFGSDIYDNGLGFAKKRLKNVKLFQMDARNIPFDNEFDIIGSFDVIEHIEEDNSVLGEFYKAVKPGGGIILTVPQHKWLWTVIDEISYHKRRYDRHELIKLVKKAGFRIELITSFITILLPILLISRLWLRFKNTEGKALNELSEINKTGKLDNCLELVCNLERFIVDKGLPLPAGGSLLWVGVKD